MHFDNKNELLKKIISRRKEFYKAFFNYLKNKQKRLNDKNDVLEK